MVPPEAQILTVILWLIVVKFCQMTVYPYLKPAVGDLSYGLAYPFSILLLTFVTWYLGVAGLPVQLALLLFVAAGVYAVLSKRYDGTEIRQNLKWDLVFFGAFFLMLISRFLTPGIIPSGEKFSWTRRSSEVLCWIRQLPRWTPGMREENCPSTIISVTGCAECSAFLPEVHRRLCLI